MDLTLLIYAPIGIIIIICGLMLFFFILKSIYVTENHRKSIDSLETIVNLC